MTSILQFLPPLVVISVLIYACYTFHKNYVLKAKELAATLEWIKDTVLTMRTGSSASRRNALNKVFTNTILEENWTEFSRTLHEQKNTDKASADRIHYRITVPAHHFFTVTTIIDKPLKVNYFKHLPGILTGIGIIGTFAGLLFGLSNFDASSPEVINKSVSLLLSGVRDAFFASVFAITAAMVVTHVEKLLYQRCLIHLEDLNEAINKMFEGGVHENYLAQIQEHLNELLQRYSNDDSQNIEWSENLSQSMRESNQQMLEIMLSKLTLSNEKCSQYLAEQIDDSLNRRVRKEMDLSVNKIIRNLKGQDDLSNERIAKIILKQNGSAALKVKDEIKAS